MIPDPASLKPEGGERKKCPRCDSTNTKFCYFNNYSRTQPRHFCRACCRYWTEGGTLRSVPAGGGVRKNKRRKITHIEKSSISVAVAGGDLRSLTDSLKSPAIYTADELLFGDLMPRTGGGSPITAAAAGSSCSSSSQYSFRSQDAVGGFEDSFLGMMNPLTEISWMNQESMLPPSCCNFWPDVMDFTDTGDGGTWFKDETVLPASYWSFRHDGGDFAGTGDGNAELRR